MDVSECGAIACISKEPVSSVHGREWVRHARLDRLETRDYVVVSRRFCKEIDKTSHLAFKLIERPLLSTRLSKVRATLQFFPVREALKQSVWR